MYTEVAASLVTDLPGIVRSFATDVGWTVSGTSITAPGGGIEWDVKAEVQVNGNHAFWMEDVALPTQRMSITRLPKLQGVVNAPAVLNPTKVHLFANTTPFLVGGQACPYIAGVIECGFNYYRHFYVGKMYRYGDWTGGDILCMNMFSWEMSGNTSVSFANDDNKRMFSASHNHTGATAAQSGGVLLNHADNVVPWKRFFGPSGISTLSDMGDTTVFGGFGDGPSDGLVRRSVSNFAGAQVTVPINLYCLAGNVGANYRVRPMGYVPGVRMLDMRSVMPGQQLDIGNVNWRAFAEFSRQPERQSVLRNNPGYYWDGETSYLLGYAYSEV